MPEAILAIQNLTIRHGATTIVEVLSFEVAGGEIVGLLGPNGCGKSSTLAAVIGDLRPAAGEIRVAGLREGDEPLAYRRRVGFVPQELAIFDELTGRENLYFFGKLYGLGGLELNRRVADTLTAVHLDGLADRRVKTLSGGMQRRLNFACALLHDPALLLLDEPTVGLDAASRDAVFAVIRRLRERGRAIVFATHHVEEAERLCDSLAVMHAGQLVRRGTVDQLAHDYGTGGWLERRARPLWPACDKNLPKAMGRF